MFYAADDRFRLYFLSSPTSRHSQNIARDGRVAVTVQADGQAWQEIRGLQIEGTANEVRGAGELAQALATFARRFDFAAGLLAGAADGPAALRGPIAGSRFYVVQPAWIRMIDNTQGFGHKEEFTLDNDG